MKVTNIYKNIYLAVQECVSLTQGVPHSCDNMEEVQTIVKRNKLLLRCIKDLQKVGNRLRRLDNETT